jgi:hypothetical protein
VNPLLTEVTQPRKDSEGKRSPTGRGMGGQLLLNIKSPPLLSFKIPVEEAYNS